MVAAAVQPVRNIKESVAAEERTEEVSGRTVACHKCDVVRQWVQ